jgi:predicted AlkP superfamily pyrophosphatase or phosphodiesterase
MHLFIEKLFERETVVRNKKLLVLILDAFSDKYLKYAYYLNKLCNENFYSTIKPLFAYEGIGTAILTGFETCESGIWHDKVFIPKGRKELKLKFLKSFIAFFDELSPTDDINKMLRFLLFKIFREDYGTPHLIPAKYLEYFATYKYKYKKISDLFQVLSKSGVKAIWVEPKLMPAEEKALKGILKLFRKHDLMILKLNSLDRLGHKYGPLSNEIRQRVEYLDRAIEETINTLQVRLENVSFIIMSDHGMIPVEKTIDIEELMTKETSIRPLIDYIPYVGSTFASFFILNKKTENIIYTMVQGLSSYGTILEDSDFKILGINKELYGHIVFALNEGVVFFPSFFQRRNVPKGMHGYSCSKYDSAVFIASGINDKHVPLKSLKYSDIFKVLIEFWAS